MRHFLYTPFTGLGLYNGFRGNAWLKKRIKIFKHFVVPSLRAQTNQNFMLWVSWRPEEKNNKHVIELHSYLSEAFPQRVVFTFSGVCFWDDKYEHDTAWIRLADALHSATAALVNYTGDVNHILMTIQPSDDCYHTNMVDEVQKELSNPDVDAVGYTKGYITSYLTGEVREYNPETNPPFFTIRFPKDVFLDPYKHIKYTGPYESHEYVGNSLRYKQLNKRGFVVGTHGENISTHFNIPYAGDKVDRQVLSNYGIIDVPPIKLPISFRRTILHKLPHRVQRKLRYIFGEKFYAKIYSLFH